MSDLKFRADNDVAQSDYAILWFSEPQHILSKIEDCRLARLVGDMRYTVYAQGMPDTFFSIPAVCWIGSSRIKGFITNDGEGNLVFDHCYF